LINILGFRCIFAGSILGKTRITQFGIEEVIKKNYLKIEFLLYQD